MKILTLILIPGVFTMGSNNFWWIFFIFMKLRIQEIFIKHFYMYDNSFRTIGIVLPKIFQPIVYSTLETVKGVELISKFSL